MRRYVLPGLLCLVASCAKTEAQELASAEKTRETAVKPSPPIPIQPVPAPVPVRKVKRGTRIEAEWAIRIGVSEGGFHIEEFKKLLQTLENMRADRPDKSLLKAMYAQSSKITRQEPFTDTRQIWVSYLPMHGDGPPEKGWVECTGQDPKTKRPVPTGCTGTWSYTVKQWRPFRDQARTIYWSGLVEQVVDGRPIQWGGDMDYWIGAGRKLCPLNSGTEFKNTYWGIPGENVGKCLPIDKARVKASKALSAAIASGRANRRHLIPKLLSDKDYLIRGLNRGADDDATRAD